MTSMSGQILIPAANVNKQLDTLQNQLDDIIKSVSRP